MDKDLDKLAREIVTQNQYVTIATSDKKGNPWISPVVYGYDKKWNLYFVSVPSSRHCQNVKINESIAAVIFDSHQLFGTGVGLYIEGAVSKVPIQEIVTVIPYLYKRKFPYGKPSNNIQHYILRFLKKRELYRVYKIQPTRFWVNDVIDNVDVRIEVHP